MKMKRTEFVTFLAADVRRRHEHFRIGKAVTGFSVQIEVCINSRWKPVVRFDTAHGFAHRDLIHPTGRVDKTPLFLQTLNEALDFAEADLRSNWKSYVEQYRREARK